MSNRPNVWKGAFSTTANLLDQDTTYLPDFTAYLVGNVGWYYLSKASTATANPPTILEPSTGPGRWIFTGGSGGGGSIIVQDEGVVLPTQPAINFIGNGVTATDDAGSSRTNVTIPGGYDTILDNASPVTQRSTVNFIGANGLNVTIADDVGNARTNITLENSTAVTLNSSIRPFTDTTALIADLAEDQLDLTISSTYIIANVTASTDCVVRVYSSQAYRTADAGRLIGDPPPLEGLVAEVELTTGNLSFDVSPHVVGINLETPQDNIIPITVINNSGGNATITATLNVITVEPILTDDGQTATYSVTTASVADGAFDDVEITIANNAIITEITTDVDARVRIYDSDAARTADTARIQGDTTIPDGLVAEVEITGGGGTFDITPVAVGVNNESPQDGRFFLQVFNNSGGPSTVQVDTEAAPLFTAKHQIQDTGTPVPDRRALNFSSGFLVVDNPGMNRTDVTSLGGRELLVANRTYYVDPAGNDSNDGLTPGTPFLTPQFAFDTVGGLDLDIYDVTIQFAAGTYSYQTLEIKNPVGSGTVICIGDQVTPGNVILNGNVVGDQPTITGSRPFIKIDGTKADLRGFRIQATGAQNVDLISVNSGAIVNIEDIEFYGTDNSVGISRAIVVIVSAQLYMDGTIVLENLYTRFADVFTGSLFQTIPNMVFTFGASCDCNNAFVRAANCGFLQFSAPVVMTGTNASAVTRADVSFNAVVKLFGIAAALTTATFTAQTVTFGGTYTET